MTPNVTLRHVSRVGLLLALCLVASWAYSSAQRPNAPVTLQFEGPLAEALVKIRSQAGINIVYNPAELDDRQVVRLRVTNAPALSVVEAALAQALPDTKTFKLSQNGSNVVIRVVPKPAPRPAPAATATVSGRLTDGETREALVGATVRLVGSGFASVTNTDLAGRFLFAAVPAGAYTFSVSYIGYQALSQEVTVQEGENVTMDDLKLTYGGIEVTGIEVTGLLEGSALAYNQQRSADNIRNIVAADLIGRYPDLNSAEALQRLPGVSVFRDQGEGRFVQIRGLDPRFQNVSVNGVQVPSADTDNRFVPLDVIPSDQIAQLEIAKSLTPDMDGDATGGYINIVTRKAVSSDLEVKGTLAGGYNALGNGGEGTPSGQGFFSVGQRLLGSRFGYNVSASYWYREFGSNNYEVGYGTADIDENGEEVEREVVEEIQLRDYELIRRRYGATLTLDYQFTPRSYIFGRVLWNRFTDHEYRRRFTLGLEPDEDEGGAYSFDGAVQEVTFAEAAVDTKDRLEKSSIQNYQLGGQFALGKATLDFIGAYSYAEEKTPFDISTEFDRDELDYRVTFPREGTAPTFTTTNGTDLYELGEYGFNEGSFSTTLGKDNLWEGRFNLKVPVTVGGNEGFLKFGGNYRSREKEFLPAEEVYGGGDDNEFTLADFAGTFVDGDFIDGLRMIQTPDPGLMRELFVDQRSNPDLYEFEVEDSREANAGFYNVQENVTAAYAMGKVTLGKLDIIGGVRYERTAYDYASNEVVYNVDGDQEGIVRLTDSGDYDFVLPSLNLRYSVTENDIVRFAYSHSFSRPNFVDITPFRVTNFEDEEIETGNPQLVPSFSRNLDLSFEHYFKNIGVASVGLFYKSIDDFIFFDSFEATDPFGIPGDFEVTQARNGDNAQLLGVEAALAYNLTFLPGFLSGLGVNANYTYVWSEATFTDRDFTTALPSQAESIINLALSYQRGGFQGRLALNYVGPYINFDEGELANGDIQFINGRSQLDLSLSQRFAKRYQVFVEVLNLTNEDWVRRLPNADRPLQVERYGVWSNFGFRFELR
ncbi:MAG: TonB-dependent receptor [Bacteroidia bacterium]|nr:TonB-dependent receptor [Bacteroidia bacterium]